MFCEEEETAVGESEHALRINAADAISTDHRARLVRIDMTFLFPFLRPTPGVDRGWASSSLRSDPFRRALLQLDRGRLRSRGYSCARGRWRKSGDVRISENPEADAISTRISKLP